MVPNELVNDFMKLVELGGWPVANKRQQKKRSNKQ